MLSEKSLTPEQVEAIERLSTRKTTLLVAATGAGKTAICLSAAQRILAVGKLTRILVACPAKVVDVWPREKTKWDHLCDVGVVPIVGDAAQRLLCIRKADKNHCQVIVVSLNNLEWLLNQKHGADGIIIDELSKAAGRQTKGLNTKARGDCFKWRVGMTATPVSQDFEKVFTMVRRLDKGKAFGSNKHAYLNKYFYSDYMGYNWTLKDGADKRILDQITKLVHMVEDTKVDDLPALHEVEQRFDMPPGTREVYNKMKKDMVTGDIEAVNAAVRDGKLRQISSGFVYDEDRNVTKLDSARLDEAVDWWLGHKRPAVIFYEYVAQGERLEAVFRNDLSASVDDFIKGKGTVLVAQISSLSHGVDGLQNVSHDALFYHPQWSRDQKEQAIGRLWRTGQNHEVTITTLVCDNTLDDVVVARVEDRAEWMDLFTKHMGGR